MFLLLQVSIHFNTTWGWTHVPLQAIESPAVSKRPPDRFNKRRLAATSWHRWIQWVVYDSLCQLDQSRMIMLETALKPQWSIVIPSVLLGPSRIPLQLFLSFLRVNILNPSPKWKSWMTGCPLCHLPQKCTLNERVRWQKIRPFSEPLQLWPIRPVKSPGPCKRKDQHLSRWRAAGYVLWSRRWMDWQSLT